MRVVSRKLAATGLMLMAGALAFGQSYYPGQSFSAGQTPAPAQQTPMAVYGQQPVNMPAGRTPQVHQYTPVPSQQRQQPAAPASMYNIEQRPASSSTPSSSSSGSSSGSSARSAARTPASQPARTSSSPAVSRSKAASSSSSSESTDKPAVTTATPRAAEAEKATVSATPVVPDSTDKLVFMNRRTGKKLVALTYDDGPNPSLTPKLINWLKENDVPATFFMQGKMVKAYPKLAKEVADMGFEVANHTYNHPDLRRRSDEEILNELQDTHDVIKEVTGIDCTVMRPPYGAHNQKVDDICRRLGYKIINWDVDTNDWRGRSADAMLETIMKQTGDGSIILMHDRKHRGRESVLEVTQKAVKELRAKGYTFVTVGELLDMTPATIATARPVSAPAMQPADAPAVTIAAPAVVDQVSTATSAVESGAVFP